MYPRHVMTINLYILYHLEQRLPTWSTRTSGGTGQSSKGNVKITPISAKMQKIKAKMKT